MAPITPARIQSEPNAELRRVMIERIGAEAYLRMANAKVVNRDVDPMIGTLYRCDLADGPVQILEVLDGTHDGKKHEAKRYHLFVPPDMTSALQANAWTWGLEAKDYLPE